MKLLDLLKKNPAVLSLLAEKNCLASLSLVEEALLLATAFQSKPQDMIVVKNNLYNAQRLFDMVSQLLHNDPSVLLFGTEESLRIEAIAASPELMAAKIDTLYRLQQKEPVLLITHAAGITRCLPSPAYFMNSVIPLQIDQSITIQTLTSKLRAAGYEEVSRVDQPLTYAKRGGIVDVFSLNYNEPLRIEFFDTVIDSIRFFDLATQRTLRVIPNAEIIPATDLLFTEAEIACIETKVQERLTIQREQLSEERYERLAGYIAQDMDYLKNHVRENRLYRYFAYLDEISTIVNYRHNPLILLSAKEEITSKLRSITEETVAYIQELYAEEKSLLTFQVNAELSAVLAQKRVTEVSQFVTGDKDIRSGIYTLSVPQLSLTQLMRQLAKDAKEKRIVLWLKENELKLAVEELIRNDIPYTIINEDEEPAEGISLACFAFPEGFELYREQLIVYTSREIFDSRVRIGRYASKFKEAEVLSSYLDLKPGDYLVHNLYGIGQYLGIVTKEIDQTHKDFLNIAYRGDDVLLVPLEQFQLVRKFVSREGVTPKLNKLGTGEWSKTKASIQANVDDIAERLLELYAKREELIGYAYGPDSAEQEQFEREFSYELTADQAQAVEEVKADMMLAKPMDRLLCGDVGFGKTEVAIRAAFKAVAEQKQVAFLCPTTILSRQHYETFMQRFKSYPVNIALLNRFVQEPVQKEIISRLKEGKIDILIGTHRILSKDIKYHDLGLLIIDEEQRFGVEHKEKVKELKQSVDVLSLSATPIPRTLQMSLIGIRSLSQLNTPPNNRMPVLTYVIERNRSVIKEIIERELVRGGQVFYLYNNVKEIFNVAMKLKLDLPDAHVAVAHGQMNRQEIEDVMYRFVNNEYNVLICTTIIETGIDIPNANTMIIDNADRFGLSQLYQIKGRVGRSDRLAYAYLMYAPSKELSEIAQKRLTAIKEFTELGSGYKIAMRDLTIRGAGDLLGSKQSGFIDTVGIDMYIEMLEEAIRSKKGLPPKQEATEAITHVPMQLDAYIPEQFAPQDYEKITLYQRIDKAKSIAQIAQLEEEIIDQYGRLPGSVELLFEKKRLELLLKEPRIQSFKESKKSVEIVFTPAYSAQADGVKLFETVNKISREIELKYLHGSIILKFNHKKDWLKEALTVLKETKV